MDLKEEIPKKYKKHKALVLLGLKTQEELDEDLTRFDANDIEGIKSTITERIKTAKVPTAYLLSLIPRSDFQKLPNCIVSSEEDFSKFEDLMLEQTRKKDTYVTSQKPVEVWAFPKEIGASIGRFAMKDFCVDFSQSQILEHVWSTNHRDIEHYNEYSKIPIISASRARWNTRYHLDKTLCIPEDKKVQYERDFITAVLNIERQREKIEEVAEYFKSLGIDSLALEYRLDSRGFSFIDWDTEHDDIVLDALFSKKTHKKGLESDAR